MTILKTCFFLLCFKLFPVFCQNPQVDSTGIRLMFYNVENLFYPINDSLKRDDEFTQTGLQYWGWNRYHKKINQIAQNIIAIGGWEPPAVVGLCEIESIECLKDLVHNSPLTNFGYKIVHCESQDERGIDVAFLYRPSYFQLIDYRSFVLKFPNTSRKSRDILYVKGMVNKDTLHCFVNHWPSRYGGELASAPRRNFAASVLRSKYDSIQSVNDRAKIIAMGDFNDYPTNESMHIILKAKKDSTNLSNGDLINMMWQYDKVTGTNKYQHEWHILDQFIVNQPLLDSSSGLTTNLSLAKIFNADWLLIDETDGFGKKPFRTYNGYKYIGGYSDHLPIYVDILIKK